MPTRTLSYLFATGLLSGVLCAGCYTLDGEFTEDIATTRARLIGADAPERIPGQYIVMFKKTVAVQSINAAMNRISLKSADSRIMNQYATIAGFSAKLSATDVEDMLHNPDVAYVEADQIMRISTTRPSPGALALDRHHGCPADDTGVFDDRGCDGSGVLVYIVDTGIRSTHEELAGRVDTARGFTFINDGRGTDDCNGHGTHVASTAAGRRYGMANGATLVPVRVLGCEGSGSNAGVIAGVEHVIANCAAGARCVANMSLGGGISPALDDAVDEAVAAGVTIVVAAGNRGSDASGSSPARVPAAITVGAASNAGYPGSADRNSIARASFSNHGGSVDIWASGLDILGADIGSDSATQIISGTSMASPHVAGAVAQLLSCQGNLSPAAIEAQLDAKAIAGAMSDERGGQDLFLCSDFQSADSPGACACPQAGDSCAGRCGQYDQTASCQCDDACEYFGDCCADKAALCSPRPGPDTCFAACGVYDPDRHCQCDQHCGFYGDCCGDVATYCG